VKGILREGLIWWPTATRVDRENGNAQEVEDGHGNNPQKIPILSVSAEKQNPIREETLREKGQSIRKKLWVQNNAAGLGERVNNSAGIK